jgi:hypothetical protein
MGSNRVRQQRHGAEDRLRARFAMDASRVSVSSTVSWADRTSSRVDGCRPNGRALGNIMKIDRTEKRLLGAVERAQWKATGITNGERARYERYAKATRGKSRRLTISLSKRDFDAIHHLHWQRASRARSWPPLCSQVRDGAS